MMNWYNVETLQGKARRKGKKIFAWRPTTLQGMVGMYILDPTAREVNYMKKDKYTEKVIVSPNGEVSFV